MKSKSNRTKKRTIIIRKKSVKTKINMLGITEIKSNYKNCKPGFIVRLSYVDDKPQIYMEFSEHKCGNKKKAFQEAIKYRDEQIKTLEKQGKWPIDHHRTKPGIRNKSGVVGVQRSRQYGNIGGGKRGPLECFSWVASWYVDGKIKTACFGETKWGAAEAFQMACDCRMARKNIYADNV